ncbi:glycosyltransferase family 4 protein [Alsobacter sp. SYSU M60028]|uniref:Glycosyltransferase family 4 protein n=1 Tax=Alsobacter ponti TaxID=2962936 RepID=A0ABT1LAB4_9HYPH|nr:glycosyltransferase family 4 protein [Alsobacter ponti]MCP8938416.1 glycosyltransferase family 4 protein [Alsobacter ponti]
MTQRKIILIGSFLSAVLKHRSVCEDLAEQLTARGWSVAAASRRAAPLGRLVDITKVVFAEGRSARVAQVDLFSGRAFLWAEYAALLLRLFGVPYVLTAHGGGLPDYVKRWPGRARRLLANAAAVTAPSGFLHRELRPLRADIRLIPNGMDLESYRFRVRAPASPTLIWVRSFHQIYNPAMAVDVVERLLPDFPGLRLTMVGPDRGDGTLAAMRELIRARGLDSAIEIVPGVERARIPALLDAADIFINTTNVDNTPVSVMEALASGLCVVSTDAGGLPDLLSDGVDALLCPRGDAAAMASRVESILRSPELAERLSNAARQTALASGWDDVMKRWDALFEEVRPA